MQPAGEIGRQVVKEIEAQTDPEQLQKVRLPLEYQLGRKNGRT
jgi:hypothetical protein